ncbi:MAG TPA: hypothetical protein VKI01_14930 [Acidimicrobiia bacterium]|nr:hypothetical protein [Acidimicrobiia bacterium]
MAAAHRGRKRRGLEGLPVNDGEVFALDGVRSAKTRSDTRALIVLWLVTVIAVALALWARSIILGVFCALALPIAVWWTIARWRSWSDTRRTPRA